MKNISSMGNIYLGAKACLNDKAVIEEFTNSKLSLDHVIGVDTYDKEAMAYSLIRRTVNGEEILLSKVMRNEADFKEEVNNLAKYFNAIFVEEK